MEVQPNKKILIVDDDFDVRQALSVKLKKQSYLVIEAGDGKSGLDKIASESPDMVIVDVNMPGMDGFEFCEHAIEENEERHIPIMVMTAQDDHDSVNRAYELGATDFITKPINHTKLVHRIRFSLRASDTAKQLASRERQLLSAQKIAKMGEWVYDIEKKQFDCSDEVANIFSIDKSKISSYENLMEHIVDVKNIDTKLENFSVKEGYCSHEYSINVSGGIKKQIRQVIDTSIHDPIMEGKIFGVFQDVTDLRNAEQQIKTLSLYDSLTGLPNRTLLKRFIEKSIHDAEEHKSRFALININLDKFMRIITNLGSQMSEDLLIAASKRLKKVIHDSVAPFNNQTQLDDELDSLAHLGGDNFLIILKDINSSDDAAILAQRIQNNFNTPFNISDNTFHITLSIGIGVYPDDGRDEDVLLKNTTIALHNAKETGRNCYRYYTEAMNLSSFQRLSIEFNLRKAVDEKQFVLHYQPKVSLIDGRITGAEALIRWNSPEMGMVSPAEFIPLSESTGLIVPMTDWLISEVCRQIEEWRKNGLVLPSVAINISPASFSSRNAENHILQKLQMLKAEVSKLEFEITESVLMEDIDIVLPVLNELKEMGANISIDDFGTGYSSLSYLKRLPLSKLKIDQSFIREVMQDKDDTIIVNAVIALAHSLGLKVIAEGVEEKEQLDYLRKQDCDVVQGYFYSKPLPADEFYCWAKDYEKRLLDNSLIKMTG